MPRDIVEIEVDELGRRQSVRDSKCCGLLAGEQMTDEQSSGLNRFR